MIFWTLIVLLLYFINLMLVSYFRYTQSDLSQAEMIKVGLGARDHVPELDVLGARADRALTNLKESLPIFITLVLLSLITGNAGSLAWFGTFLFAICRILYLPAYLWSGVHGLRSAIWMVSIFAMLLILFSLC